MASAPPRAHDGAALARLLEAFRLTVECLASDDDERPPHAPTVDYAAVDAGLRALAATAAAAAEACPGATFQLLAPPLYALASDAWRVVVAGGASTVVLVYAPPAALYAYTERHPNTIGHYLAEATPARYDFLLDAVRRALAPEASP